MATGIQWFMATLTILLPLLIQPASAEIDYAARCAGSSFLCLTSFIWCHDDDCDYPENVYPFPLWNKYAGLIWHKEYNLTWKRVHPDYPVNVQWVLAPGDDESEQITWERNFTSEQTSFSFTFMNLASEIEDVDDLLIKGVAASLFNHFVISQPGRLHPPSGNTDRGDVADTTSQFTILDNWAEDLLAAQRKIGEDDMSSLWKRKVDVGVGLGVGLGVPIFMAVSFVGGIYFGKRRANRVAEHKMIRK